MFLNSFVIQIICEPHFALFHRSAESAIGEGKVKFLCFEEKCELEFPKNALQKVLSSKLFSTLLRKVSSTSLNFMDMRPFERFV